MRQRIRKRPWMIPALLLVLVFAMGLLVEAIRPLGVFAAHTDQRVSDPPTNASQDYEDALGSTSSTRYNGRVWADKSVYTDDVKTDIKYEGENYTVPIGDADFLLSYSLLAATAEVEGQSLVPLDVVFVIDLSDSMKGDKIRQTVVALNQSVQSLMTGNPDTRIGVVTYNNNAQVLLPLDHYTKAEGKEAYFTLSEDGLTLHTHVKGSAGEEWKKNASMGNQTNIHMGIDTGMDLLLAADIKTASGEVRHPALMLMSDGAPTASGDVTTDWWAPSGMDGKGWVDSTGVDALKAMMNASYQKQQVSRYYGMDLQVYTVGVGVDQLEENGPKETAELTLNPSMELNSDNYYANQVKSAWETYIKGLDVTICSDRGTKYTFRHPDSKNEIQTLFYNDAYFSANAAEDIASAFQQVMDKIIVTGAAPTQVGDDPTSSGYITYVDPIGRYMEVTDVKGVTVGNQVHNVIKGETNGNVTSYVCRGTMTSPIYGQHAASNIIITVTTDEATGDQTLTVKVPAALIPLRTNKVTINEDGTVENEPDNNGPLQLFYTVSLREYVTRQMEDDNTICGNPNRIVVEIPTGEVLPNGEQKTKNYVNLAALTDEYIQTHTNPDGTIRFYPNLYTGDVEDQAGVEKTVGNAYVYFQAASTNPFYYVQKDTPVYADKECNIPATDKNGELYVQLTYYDGKKIVTKAVPVTSIYDLEDVQTNPEDGLLYLKAESKYIFRDCTVDEKDDPEHHHNSDCDDVMDKGDSNNLSGTAETYRYPIYQTGEQEGSILVWLGNNGVENLPVLTGDLNISKTVTGNKGELDKGFVFDITVQRNETKPTGMFEATKTTTTDTGTTSESISVEFNQGKAQVILQHNQSITIHGLPSGFTYTVAEQDPAPDKDANIYNGEDYVVSATQNGKTVEWTEGATYICTGIIACLETSEVAYTNDLNVPLVDYSFTKVDGEEFDQANLEEAILLPGAQFTLYHYTGDDWDTDSGVLLDTTQHITNWETVMTVTSDEDGVVLMEDLQAGRYRLVETKAPDGYKLPKGQWNFQVSRDKETGLWSFDIEAVKDAAKEAPAMALVNGKFYLMNYKPINPPITGGDGGEDFRIGGSLLMFTGLVLACWWMWSSPRRRSEFL